MTRLRVALDGRPLQSPRLGGVGRYLVGLIPYLAEETDVYVLLDARQPSVPARVSESAECISLRCPPGLPGLAWLELVVAPWLRRFDGVFHATFNTLPITSSGPSVLTLHDLATQLHPEDFRPLKRAAWRLNIRVSLSRADVITTVSRFVKNQIVDYFGLDPGRVRVAPDALDPVFDANRASDAPALISRLGITPPYLVAVGGAPRRGLPVAIEAWRLTKQRLGREVTLVVAGNSEASSEPGIVAPGFLDDESWATLLAGAQALCYPTRYEGFGLPALEAAASGTPVACARVASLPEVLGDAGCWVSEPSPQPMADALIRLLTDREFHGERRAAGLERARNSASFAEVAQTLVGAYRDAFA
jgi:glycosyltransferase involved in cell wall biosynthesis